MKRLRRPDPQDDWGAYINYSPYNPIRFAQFAEAYKLEFQKALVEHPELYHLNGRTPEEFF